MTDTRSDSDDLIRPDTAESSRGGWLAAGGFTGAILASTCCIGPLLLVTLGVSGAWIGTLTVLEPYKNWFGGAALVFIGLGFRQVYFKTREACDEGSYCARPQSALITKGLLWFSTGLVALALTINWWAPMLY